MRNVSDYAGFLTFAPGAHGVDAIYLTPLAPDEGAAQGHDEHEAIKTLAAVIVQPGWLREGAEGRGRGRVLLLHDRHRADQLTARSPSIAITCRATSATSRSSGA